jgi:hypothetical protein
MAQNSITSRDCTSILIQLASHVRFGSAAVGNWRFASLQNCAKRGRHSINKRSLTDKSWWNVQSGLNESSLLLEMAVAAAGDASFLFAGPLGSRSPQKLLHAI